MESKSFVSILLEEQFDFCYTQKIGVYGIGKDFIEEKFKFRRDSVVKNYFQMKHCKFLDIIGEDDNYFYVCEKTNE